MGVLIQTVRLADVDGGQSLDVEAVVDTGTLFTMVPAPLLRELGVSPFDRFPLVLEDGRRVEYDLGGAIATAEGRSIHTLVLFGGTTAARAWGPTRWMVFVSPLTRSVASSFPTPGSGHCR